MTPPDRPQHPFAAYPWSAVSFAMLMVLIIVVLGSFALDAIWAERWLDVGRPAAAAFRGTCYWMSDNRILVRIASHGYTDYGPFFQHRHLSMLPDRSWWPVYINLTALTLRLTGGDYCAGWLVNLVAMVLLVPVIQAITKTRRPSLLVGVALLPFGIWLYAGLAEGTFLLTSGLTLWASLRRPSPRWWASLLWGGLALALGILAGLTKPNALALIPGFGTLALTRTVQHLRATSGTGPRWRRLLDDANPGWFAALGTMGIALGLGAWFYQTSGYYPFYVAMVQRTLWYREFDGGNVFSFLNYITESWRSLVVGARLPYPPPWDTMEFAALTLTGILPCRDLPPRWPGARVRRTPFYAVVGMVSVFVLVFLSGQAHAVERYMIGNIFFVIIFLRYVYGDDDEPSLAGLPRLIHQRGPESLRAALRLTVFVCAQLLTVVGTLIMIAQVHL